MLKYYDLAEDLISVLEKNKNNLTEYQMGIIELMVENLERQSDTLTGDYVEFINKESKSIELIDSIQDAFGVISLIIKEGKKELLASTNK